MRDLEGTRILAVLPSIPVLGMERANIKILTMMRDRGAEVLVVVNSVPGEKVSAELDRVGLAFTRVPIVGRLRLPRSLPDAAAMSRAWLVAARGIHRVHGSFEPTHVHLTGLACVWFAAPLLWRTRATVVFRQPNVVDRSLSGAKQWLHDQFWRRLVAPLCDVIICNSQCSRDRLMEVLPSAQTRLIYNCVADLHGAGSGRQAAEDNRPFTVVFLGQVEPTKGIEVLIDAATEMVGEDDRLRFHVVGWLSPYAQKLAKKVEAAGLGARIRFFGERQGPGEAMADADLHVCPSICEDSCPNTVLEAKSHGIPSVVFPSGGLPELVTHEVDGYVCEGKTAAALRAGLLYFRQDSRRLHQAGAAARASLSRFAPERIAAQWADVFRVSAAGDRA